MEPAVGAWCGDSEADWLPLPAAPGAWREVDLPLPAVRGEIVGRIWSPDTPTGNVLVAHDGPDFERYGELGRYTAAMIGARRVPPYHLVLLPAGERLEWYSCGTAEENLANNRDMADALRRQGYPVTLAEVPDAHNWTGWRDALDPHLTSLLQRVFA